MEETTTLQKFISAPVLSKEAQANVAADLVAQVVNGNVDPITAFVQMKAIGEVAEQFLKNADIVALTQAAAVERGKDAQFPWHAWREPVRQRCRVCRTHAGQRGHRHQNQGPSDVPQKCHRHNGRIRPDHRGSGNNQRPDPDQILNSQSHLRQTINTKHNRWGKR